MAVVLVAAAALVVALASTLAQRQHRRLGGNGVAPGSFVRVVEPGGRSCEDVPAIPAGTGFVGMLIGTYGPPGPPIHLMFGRRGHVAARGGLAAGWKQGDILVPITAAALPAGAGRMCLRNDGPERLALAGFGDRFRVDYLTASKRSWLGWSGLISDRFAQGKSSVFGGWSLPVTLALVALAAGLALATMLRAALR